MSVIETYIPQYSTITKPMPVFTAANEPRTFGTDVSKGNGAINWIDAFEEGIKFAAIRCSVGDYYKDPNFSTNWTQARNANIMVMPYLVVAPAWSPEYGVHPVTASQHWTLFKEAFGERVPDMPIVLDCELTRNQSKAYITDLIDELIWKVFYDYGRMPIIYTRQTWWDTNTNQRTVFGQCDLWAARYNEFLDGPWGDGKYKFRDWDYWHFWQYSKTAKFDFDESLSSDADYFNGTLEDLLVYCEQPPTDPVPDPETIDRIIADIIRIDGKILDMTERIEVLEALAHQHDEPVDPPLTPYVSVEVVENDKVVAYYVDDFNANGKPMMEKYEPLIRYDYPETVLIKPSLIETAHEADFYEMADRGVGDAKLFCRADKVKI